MTRGCPCPATMQPAGWAPNGKQSDFLGNVSAESGAPSTRRRNWRSVSHSAGCRDRAGGLSGCSGLCRVGAHRSRCPAPSPSPSPMMSRQSHKGWPARTRASGSPKSPGARPHQLLGGIPQHLGAVRDLSQVGGRETTFPEPKIR